MICVLLGRMCYFLHQKSIELEVCNIGTIGCPLTFGSVTLV